MKISLSRVAKEAFQNGNYSLKCLDKLCVQPTEMAAVPLAAKEAREAMAEESRLLKNMTIESHALIVPASFLNWLVRGICLIVSNL